MKKRNSLILISTLLIVAIMLGGCGQASKPTTANNEKDKSLLIYCAAGLKKPMDEIGEKFEKQNGVKAEFTYANASDLIGQMEISHKGDICVLPSNKDYETANKKELTLDKKDLTYHTPVIAVPKGNPLYIKNLQDFSKSGVRVILGDPETSPLGKLAMKLFTKVGIQDEVKPNVVSTVSTVNEIVTYLSMKKADASIVWEDNALNAAKDIDCVQIPNEQNSVEKVNISTLKSCEDNELCQKFIDFTNSDEGKAIFIKNNLKPIE
ncbi:molybdate ABC transporter substrate-binding protein [Clostridium botulinum]|nr:molybdate ABC transporter substrate-binding protein [Clostridium botulinum]NFL58140.1 molybdate ABC transporter substrate-binding protein [Clostridium botulinum]NFL62633.1 molybdate ABC transporter substrate-binding protein [Clostridium botulinum]NFO66271.1 molybdate ABC transporter substrate-binding protein [Clostridium botulinum]NFS10052.1 molybdate ABC transporter substrate-binding protein [Clostridium botulinum]